MTISVITIDNAEPDVEATVTPQEQVQSDVHAATASQPGTTENPSNQAPQTNRPLTPGSQSTSTSTPTTSSAPLTPSQQVLTSRALNPIVSLIRTEGTSPGEFRSPKRKRVRSPVKSSTAASVGDGGETNDEEGEVMIVIEFSILCYSSF